MENERIVSAEGELRLLSSDRKKLKQRVELRLLNSLVNRNNWQYLNIEENAKREGTGLADTPILCAYVGDRIGDGHNFRMTRDENGDEVADFRDATAERMVGIIRDIGDVRMEVIDGVEWLVATGTIFTWYAAQLVEKLKETGALSVSIETLIDEGHFEGDVEVFTKYTFLGTTILNEDVAPAVRSANIKALSAIGVDEMRRLTLKVASFDEKSAKSAKNNTKGVKHTMRIKDAEKIFPGFSVLAADGNTVALLSDNGTIKLCAVNTDGENIVAGEQIDATTETLVSAGETTVKVPTDAIIEKLNSRISALEGELDEERNAKNTVTLALEAMQKAEKERRKEAVKAAVKNRVKEIAQNSNGVVAENECDDLLADDKVLEFAEMECDGKFTGDIEACKEVDARCMSKMIEASKRAKNTAISWNGFVGSEHVDEGENNPLKNITK